MRTLRIAALAAAAALLPPGATGLAARPAATNWATTVAVTPAGTHVLGNPQAPVKVTEFISYTCPHCAHFDREAEAPLKVGYVRTGKVSVELRHLVRDPVDLTVAALTNCGTPQRFFRNHTAFLRDQERWLAAASATTEAQRQRWTAGADNASRLRAIASDLGFYPMMERLRYARTDTDRCLADDAKMRIIVSQRDEAQRLGVKGTPSFTINGTLLDDTYDWASLETQIKSRL